MEEVTLERARLSIAADRAELAERAACEVARLLEAAVAARGRATLCLAGGSTPRDLYRHLGHAPLVDEIPWRAVELYWGDERAVPPDHPESNYRMVREALLDGVPIPAENVHRIRGEEPPDRAALSYERDLRATFRLGPGERPRFDLVLLGLGADAHTASLFPHTGAARVDDRLCFAVRAPALASERITLSIPVLNAAREVRFVVAGRDKADAVRTVLRGRASVDDAPAAAVRPLDGRLVWWLDRDAASALDLPV